MKGVELSLHVMQLCRSIGANGCRFDCCHYFVTAVIFVVDSSNKERIKEAHEELAKLMAEKRLKDALILVLANKQVAFYA